MIKISEVYGIKTANGRTTEEVIAAGNYSEKHDWVNGDNFPMRFMVKDFKKIVLLGFDHDVGAGEVLAAAIRRGLERPRYEDALLFGEQYPEEQCESSIVFLHEPWWGPRRSLFVLMLSCINERRYLGLGFCKKFLFDRHNRFAFVVRE